MRLFMKFCQTNPVAVAAYRIDQDPRLPSAKKEPRERRRPDPLSAIFEQEVVPILAEAPGLRPIAIFEEMIRRHLELGYGIRRMIGASLAVCVIGLSMAQTRGKFKKHGVKQVDRLLSNCGVVVWDMFEPWIAEMVGQRHDNVVALAWTDFDPDDQLTLLLSLVTNHGRATPLLWLTVMKDELKNQRNDFEDFCLSKQAKSLPDGVKVTILADRGFGESKLFEFLSTLCFGYVIRFRGNVSVKALDGEIHLAAEWVGKGGRARKLRAAAVTAERVKV
jgi:hypothetical protein